MTAKEHPVSAHEEILSTLRRDVDDQETRIRLLEKVSTAREEQIKNLYENVGAIKLLVEQLGIKMDKLAENIELKLNVAVADLDKRIKTLEAADGEKWKKFVWIIIASIVSLIVGYLL